MRCMLGSLLSLLFVIPQVTIADEHLKCTTIYPRRLDIELMSDADFSAARPVARVDEFEFNVAEVKIAQGRQRLRVVTWYGATGWLDEADVYITPAEVIRVYTERIEAARMSPILDPNLPLYFQLRGVAWQQFNEEQDIDRTSRQLIKKAFAEGGDLVVPSRRHACRMAELLRALGHEEVAQQLIHLAPHFDKVPRALPIEAEPISDLPMVDGDIKDFKESLRLFPVQADVYLLRGLVWLDKARNKSTKEDAYLLGSYYDVAIQDFDRALRVCETSARTHFARAEARHERWKLGLTKELCALKKDKTAWLKNLPPADDPELAVQKKAAQARVAEAKRGVAHADSAFTLANECYTLERENLIRMGDFTKADKANEALKKAFERAEIAFNETKADWKIARTRAARAHLELDEANRLLDKLMKQANAAADRVKASGEEGKKIARMARLVYDEIKSEMEIVIGDFNDVLRLRPEITIAAARRDEVLVLWDKAKADLKPYLDLDK